MSPDEACVLRSHRSENLAHTPQRVHFFPASVQHTGDNGLTIGQRPRESRNAWRGHMSGAEDINCIILVQSSNPDLPIVIHQYIANHQA